MSPNKSPFLEVIIVPSVVDGALVRGVELPDGSARLEVFNGFVWETAEGFSFGEAAQRREQRRRR